MGNGTDIARETVGFNESFADKNTWTENLNPALTLQDSGGSSSALPDDSGLGLVKQQELLQDRNKEL